MKELTEKDKKNLLLSMEKICNVVLQKIIKGQEIRGINMIDDINKSYFDIIDIYPDFKEELDKVLNSQFNFLLNQSKDKGFLLISNKIEENLLLYK